MANDFMRRLLSLLLAVGTCAGRIDAQCEIPPITAGFGANGSLGLVQQTFPNPAIPQTSVYVYLPDQRHGPSPVIFFAPGYGAATPAVYAHLIEHIVSRGHAVVFAAIPFVISEIESAAVMRYYDYFLEAIEESVRRYPSALDTTRVGYLGHSFGGGALPYLSGKGVAGRGWGKAGVFLFVMAPWYMYGVTQEQLSRFPSGAKLIMQVYSEDRINDHRIAMDMFHHINIPDDGKEYVVLYGDSWLACHLDADHHTPLSSEVAFGIENALDYYGVYRLLDALAAHTFEGDSSAGAIALGHGALEQRFMGRWSSGVPVKELSASIHPQPINPESFYLYAWNDPLNPRLEATSVPYTLQLLQNYPNPFNRVTGITFSIAVADRVVITVYDLLGRKVAVLLDATLDAGEHKTDFSPDNLSSGVYFLLMQAGGRMQQRSMVYLR